MSREQLSLVDASPPEVRWIDDKRLVKPNQLEAFARWVATTPEIVLDYETDGLDAKRGCKPFMAGFHAPDKGTKIVELRLTGEQGLQAVRDGLKARTGLTIVHGGKNELSMSKPLGVEIGGKLWDNHAAAFALNEIRDGVDGEEGHSQKSLVHSELKRETPYAAAIRTWMAANLGTHKTGHQKNPLTLEVPYNAEDVQDAWDLYCHFKPQLERAGMTKLVETDSELCRCVNEMEQTGILFDTARARELADDFATQIVSHAKEVNRLAGRSINASSHKELFGLLYGDLKFPMHSDIEKHGKLDDDVLEWFKTLDVATPHVPLIDHLQTLRELDKLHGTYLLPWVYEHSYKGRLFPNLNEYIARTRRFTADSPNLQNIPNRTKLGKLIRSVFMCDPGYTTYSCDYSQIEFRFFAHYADEPALTMGFIESALFDIHEEISRLLEVVRADGKHLNFGCLYGMGVEKLARKLRCSKERAKTLLNAYYARFPKIKALRHRLEAEIRAKGYVRDVFGGRRHLTPAESYKGLNSLCQMSAANLIRSAMTRVYPLVKSFGGDMLLQIHDELLFRLPGVPEDHKQQLAEIRHVMKDYPRMRIPVLTDTEYYTTNLAELKPYAYA